MVFIFAIQNIVMILIEVKDGESIDRALKRFKKKFEKVGVMKELRGRQAYEKKSVTLRQGIIRAAYRQKMQNQSGI
jgi:small subunit ribosomal protein S21